MCFHDHFHPYTWNKVNKPQRNTHWCNIKLKWAWLCSYQVVSKDTSNYWGQNKINRARWAGWHLTWNRYLVSKKVVHKKKYNTTQYIFLTHTHTHIYIYCILKHVFFFPFPLELVNLRLQDAKEEISTHCRSNPPSETETWSQASTYSPQPTLTSIVPKCLEEAPTFWGGEGGWNHYDATNGQSFMLRGALRHQPADPHHEHCLRLCLSRTQELGTLPQALISWLSELETLQPCTTAGTPFTPRCFHVQLEKSLFDDKPFPCASWLVSTVSPSIFRPFWHKHTCNFQGKFKFLNKHFPY